MLSSEQGCCSLRMNVTVKCLVPIDSLQFLLQIWPSALDPGSAHSGQELPLMLDVGFELLWHATKRGDPGSAQHAVMADFPSLPEQAVLGWFALVLWGKEEHPPPLC